MLTRLEELMKHSEEFRKFELEIANNNDIESLNQNARSLRLS